MVAKIPIQRKMLCPALNLMSHFSGEFWRLRMTLHPRGQLPLAGELHSVCAASLGQ